MHLSFWCYFSHPSLAGFWRHCFFFFLYGVILGPELLPKETICHLLFILNKWNAPVALKSSHSLNTISQMEDKTFSCLFHK